MGAASGVLYATSAFDMPRYVWDSYVNDFVTPPADAVNAVGTTAARRVAAHRDRYHLIYQRLMRNAHFQRATLGSSAADRFDITPVKNLVGQAPGMYLLFGMLTQMSEHKLHLEDLDDTTGFFTHHAFVLVEGYLRPDRSFEIHTIAMPPAEERTATLKSLNPTLDFTPLLSEQDTAQLLQIERTDDDASIVFVSDVWLDQPHVVQALRVMLEGFVAQAPTISPRAFVLMGNFTLEPFVFSPQAVRAYRAHFAQLGSLLAEFPALAACHFILVPGPTDPVDGMILPQPAIPRDLLSDLYRKAPANFSISSMSNPCRIRYCTQDIVVFRQDLMAKMRRHLILKPDVELEPHMHQHLAKTVIDQSHLCPLPMRVQPRHASFDHALRLFPTPHVVVLADRVDAYQARATEADVFNPGSFPNNGFSFMLYYPSNRTVEEG
ncbi:hypothetical protein CXG81DRAFT_13681 [Caulochytrium protostelioides]|uniref:DNA polymerase epsilon subunit B n=1 Tax=Caulochytrium protostelioides TaxID=1555241 RepID=A0A4P9X4T4_9FUNG|nr:hypothetical protein CXG81DRAFT_13681 [Caulochytrium protostelioides]|eukprot:RKP00061.1 hypothetical protein CXG81DRAFT_13681 [Caulochytrium protostelioides]